MSIMSCFKSEILLSGKNYIKTAKEKLIDLLVTGLDGWVGFIVCLSVCFEKKDLCLRVV